MSFKLNFNRVVLHAPLFDLGFCFIDLFFHISFHVCNGWVHELFGVFDGLVVHSTELLFDFGVLLLELVAAFSQFEDVRVGVVEVARYFVSVSNKVSRSNGVYFERESIFTFFLFFLLTTWFKVFAIQIIFVFVNFSIFFFGLFTFGWFFLSFNFNFAKLRFGSCLLFFYFCRI